MSKVIRIHQYGGPEQMRLEALPAPHPGPDEVVIRQEAIGVNFIDIYFRTGLYKFPALPGTPGTEGVGVIEAVGSNVHTLQVGQRVAYAGVLGAYADRRAIAASRVVPVPPDIAPEIAAAALLRGMTAYCLLHDVRPLAAGETILVHSAAGGVGLFLCQWARHLGARVIGVVSSPAKAELARANGANEVLVGTDDLPARVRALTDGALVPVVYDATGRDNFIASLDCLAPRGLMVSYGNASGEVTDISASMLAARGSLYLTRPTLTTYVAQRIALETASGAVFEAIRAGVLKVVIGQTFTLDTAADAHIALASRATTGSTILVP